MKSNPYVYPYTPFADLSDKIIRWRLNDKKVFSNKHLVDFLSKLKFPLAKAQGKSLEKKILSLFLDQNILYGEADYILDDKQLWLEKINYFTSKNKPLQFTIHGFPFKIPNPLKTNRTLPDLGEILMLLKLGSVIQSVEKIYKPGAIITIIGEGRFAFFSGNSETEWKKYRDNIKKLINLIDFNSRIRVVDISEIEKNPRFKSTNQKLRADVIKRYKKGDDIIVKKVLGAYDSILRIVSTRNYDEETLMDIYNEQMRDPKILKSRKALEKRAMDCVFSYHAYLMTRDELDFVEKTVPHQLALTVSPKRGRLGVIPIAPYCIRLAYHGIPIYDSKKRQVTIEYLIDTKRQEKEFTPVHLKGDPDSTPFFYIL